MHIHRPPLGGPTMVSRKVAFPEPGFVLCLFARWDYNPARKRRPRGRRGAL